MHFNGSLFIRITFLSTVSGGRRRMQKHRRDIPVLPVVGDDSNGRAIVLGSTSN